MKPHHISELIAELPSEKQEDDLSQEAWEIHQRIGRPQQGKEAQEAWDTMQEAHLAQVQMELNLKA